MKDYRVKGIYNGVPVRAVTLLDGASDTVEVELHLVNKDVIVLEYPDKKGYYSFLFHKRDGTTARKYLKQLHLKVVETVI